ncbi:MAG: VCBS repeat-containing protein, partial [Methylococcaceae bacterium]
MANFKLSSEMDYISGTSGNDVIDETTTGNLNIYDYIDGGAGEDVIIMDESSTDFLDAIATLSFLGMDSKTAITTAYPSVKNIEKIQFTDVTYTLADGSVEPISTTKPSENPITPPTNLKSVTFSPQRTFSVGTKPYSVSVTDVNNDGNADVVTANFNSNNVSMLLGNGRGNFAAQTTVTVGS